MIKLLYTILFATLFVFGLRFINTADKELESVNKTIQANPSSATIQFHYEDSFSIGEKVKVEKWLTTTAFATQDVLGVFPFMLNFYIHRSKDAGEPVPWAHTQRSTDQGVHFHIDTEYSLQEFLKDWTAPHEISHLAIPFVGKSNSWFAEGFATYMQNEILLAMGQCTQADIDVKYASKFNDARPYYQVDEPFAEVAMALRKKHRYPEMYWGGALFFVQLDEILKEENNISLCDLFQDYEPCCRLKDNNLSSVLNSFDSLVNGSPANDLMQVYKTQPARTVFTE
jgi:hypothetical protein